MKKTLKTLIVIFAVAAILLGASFLLQGVAKDIQKREHIKLMETLLPGGKDFIRVDEKFEDELIRSVHKSSIGYVVETSVWGYADEITMFIGLDNSGIVTGLVVYDAKETLGLGSEILTDHEFLAQFLNKTGTFTVGSVKEDAFTGATNEAVTTGKEIGVDGISGATVSSKAVVRSVNAAIGYVTGADVQSSATSWGGQ